MQDCYKQVVRIRDGSRREELTRQCSIVSLKQGSGRRSPLEAMGYSILFGTI